MAETALSAASLARNPTMPAAPAIDSNQDACLLKAFALWQSLHAEREALPANGSFQDEQTIWGTIDRVETEVVNMQVTTPAGVACKLWIALTHNTQDHETEAAAFRADLAWFDAQGDAPDWNVKCIVSAIRALKMMEG